VISISELNIANETHPIWVWLPGWSFSATIFKPLYSQLAGKHLLVDYCATTSMDEIVISLAELAPDNAIWCGWSLGGALAQRVCADKQHKGLVTLGTGKRFIGADPSSWGMPEQDFATFNAAFAAAPAKTLKRFNSLVTQGSTNPRNLMRVLAEHQQQPSAELSDTLNWLSYDALTSDNQPDPKTIHIYGQADALNPGGLVPQTLSPGSSHVFFLEDSGREHLLQKLLKIADSQEEKNA